EMVNREIIKKVLPEVRIGIGLNSGQVVVGNIGSEERAKYGIVGSAVNITSRIQSQAKGGEVVLSDSLYRHVADTLKIKRSFHAALKGVETEVTLHVLDLGA
ncbi:MAG: adenylate/guanylate cyclase domain-containing protein, partial [Thermodesulfobacteriota bacterium]